MFYSQVYDRTFVKGYSPMTFVWEDILLSDKLSGACCRQTMAGYDPTLFPWNAAWTLAISQGLCNEADNYVAVRSTELPVTVIRQKADSSARVRPRK